MQSRIISDLAAVAIYNEMLKRKSPPTKTFKSQAKRRKISHQQPLTFQRNALGFGTEKKDLLRALPTTVGVVGAVTFTAATLLNPTVQGTAATGQRLGRKITMTSLLVRYSCTLATTSVGGAVARILIVYDKQTNGATPAITDILTNNDFTSPMNLDNTDRFTILMDELTDPISVGNNFSIAKNRYVKMKLDSVYSTNNGDVTDIKTGGVFAFIAQTGGVTTTVGTVDSFTRIRFLDS